jgi:benzylsuccinate CoA-transferase BbsF subunit
LFAVLAALDHRARSAVGQHISLSQYEATVAALGDVMLEQLANGSEPPRLGNGSRWAAPHGCYRCAGEDDWCVIAVTDDAAWHGLCATLAMPAWLDDARLATATGRVHLAGEIDPAIEAWTRQRTAADAMATLQAAGVPAAAVQNVADQFTRDPQLAARHFFERIEHAVKGSVIATGIPLGVTDPPGRSGRAGAAVGQDNVEVLGGLLGMSAREIAELTRAGALEIAD